MAKHCLRRKAHALICDEIVVSGLAESVRCAAQEGRHTCEDQIGSSLLNQFGRKALMATVTGDVRLGRGGTKGLLKNLRGRGRQASYHSHRVAFDLPGDMPIHRHPVRATLKA